MPTNSLPLKRSSLIQHCAGRPAVWLATGVAVVIATMLHVSAAGSVALTTLDVAYTQNFDTLVTSGTSDVLPTGWALSESGTNANTTYTAGTGSANSGDTYSFGATNSTERALGGLQSGSLVPTIGASFTNSTGGVITSIDIAYVGEQWRLGTTGRGADKIDFQYSFDATSLSTGSWTDADALDFTSPNTGPTFGLLDGNAAANRTSRTGTLSGFNLTNGSTMWIRWVSVDVTGADDGLGVDDFSLTPHGVPGNVHSNPTATGSAAPSSAAPGETTVLTANVVPGANPVSTGIAVTCNLTAIGGSAITNLPLASGNRYSTSVVVAAGTVPQGYSIPCTVTDAEGGSTPFTISLTVIAPLVCDPAIRTSTAIHTIQTIPAPIPVGTTVEVEGIVVGDFQSTSQLRGFYLQEPDDRVDGDVATSEGIFVFDNGAGLNVNVGDRVRVKGAVAEFSASGSFLGTTRVSTLTEINSVQKLNCGTGSVTPTVITLPLASLATFEQYEGMLVSIEQPLVVTGNFSLGTFGQVDLAPSVLFTPTAQPDNTPDKAVWNANAALLPRSVIALDDASTAANASLYPTLYPTGGLSATNTLRVGAIVNYDPVSKTNTPLVGILDDRFGAYRIEPTAPVTFYAANPRPAVEPGLAAAGGRFRAVSANVLNFFTSLNGRGATTPTEFAHQKTKIVEALVAMNGDVYGLSEVQNAVSGGTGGAPYTNAALQSLVDGLNCTYAGEDPLCLAPPTQPFAFIDTLLLGDANGTDAIRSAIVYRIDRLLPLGSPALYYQNDTNRPTLAQTFQPLSGRKAGKQSFTFVVNHFRSKGSACGNGQDDPLQGNCNGLRLNMAQNVVSWLATNPTADGADSRKLLLVGDFNAYYGEDPIQYFASQGFTNLIAKVIGPSAYSYNFGSQRGYLDHAIVNRAMDGLVSGVAEWHNNSDEPSSLQALGSANKSAAAQVAYYGADPYAASDHDPIVIGFNPLAGDLNDDGVVDNTDRHLMLDAMGSNATAVDRRMDFDGDGIITMRDFVLWTKTFVAFVRSVASFD